MFLSQQHVFGLIRRTLLKAFFVQQANSSYYFLQPTNYLVEFFVESREKTWFAEQLASWIAVDPLSRRDVFSDAGRLYTIPTIKPLLWNKIFIGMHRTQFLSNRFQQPLVNSFAGKTSTIKAFQHKGILNHLLYVQVATTAVIVGSSNKLTTVSDRLFHSSTDISLHLLCHLFR